MDNLAPLMSKLSVKSDQERIEDFLTKNNKSSQERDEIIKILAPSIILSCPTLKELVIERQMKGKWLNGWTKGTEGTFSDSKGSTDVSTGNIWIRKGTNVELLTLGYECVNSRNRELYDAIFKKYMQLPDNASNRQDYAKEILRVEAQAVYMKCRLAEEMQGKVKNLEGRELVKPEYLEIFRRSDLEESEKLEELAKALINIGTVGKYKISAYEHYQNRGYQRAICNEKIINQYAQLPDSQENRQAFAREMLRSDAEEIYFLCKQAKKKGNNEIAENPKYLEIINDASLPEKKDKIEAFVRYLSTKPQNRYANKNGYSHYQNEGYNEDVLNRRK